MSRHAVFMVLRDGKPARVKHCAKCGEEKTVSDDSGASEFPVNSRAADGHVDSWKTLCKDCWREDQRAKYAAVPKQQRSERNRRHYRQRMADPEQRKRRRASDGKRQDGYLRDPVKRKAIAATQRAWRERQKRENLEEYRAKRRAYAEERLDVNPDAVRNAQAAYRASKAAREGREFRPKKHWDYERKYVAAPPFADWLRVYAATYQLVGEEGNALASALAEDLGLIERRVRSVLTASQPTLTIDAVDTAFTNARGPVVIDDQEINDITDLYGEGVLKKEKKVTDEHDWVISPGEVLEDWMVENGLADWMTKNSGRRGLEKVARDCSMSPERLQRILDGKPIGFVGASKLQTGTGIPARLWLKLEQQYRLGLREGKQPGKLGRQARLRLAEEGQRAE